MPLAQPRSDLVNLIVVLVIGLGVDLVGSLLAVGRYRATATGPLERSTIMFLVKLFWGIGAICPVGYLLPKYVFGPMR